jgi:autotransporter-associated beta strand protein
LPFGEIVLNFGGIVRACFLCCATVPQPKPPVKNILPSSRRKNHPLGAVIASALLALSSPLAAQTTYTWDNGSSNNLWTNSTNWVGDPSLTFDNQTAVIFDPASVAVANRGNTTAIGGNLTINSLTVKSNYTTSNNATFDIRTYQALGATAQTLTFAATSGNNASITVEQSTSGTVQVRLGNSGGGNVILNTNLNLAQHNTFFSATGFQFDGPVSGVGTINKTGLGEVRLVRNNTNWSGGMNINEGNVTIFNDPNAMGTGTWTLGGGATNTSFTVGSTVSYNNAGGIVVAAGAGTRTIINAGTAITTGNPILNGNITLNKDATFAITQHTASSHDRLSANGTITGTGGIVKTGTGILILSGSSNNYSGATDIQGGKLYLAGAGRLGSGAVTISNGANVDFATGSGQTNIVANNISGAGLILQNVADTDTRFTGDVTSTGGMTINTGTVRIGNGTTTGSYNGAATVASGAALAFARDNAYTHSGAISGAGGVSKTAAGDVTLTASNSYSGVTALFTGALVADHANALGTGNITFSSIGGNSGTIRYSAASAGTDWASRIKNSTGTIRLDTAGNNVNLAGVIDSSNTNGLAKSGTGTLTLGGNNAYGGNTTVSAGALLLDTNGSLRFVIGGSGTNNAVLGSGTTLLDGRFAFDLAAASTNTNATWTIVAGTLTNSYGTNFIVTGFSGNVASGLWTNTTNGVSYVFAQSNSVLSVQPGTSVTPYNAWVAFWQTNSAGFTDTAGNADPDGDGFINDVEFAFDGNPTVGTPALMTVTPVGSNAVFNWVERTNGVLYTVQKNSTLTNTWTAAAGLNISNSANTNNVLQAPTYVRKEFIITNATGNDFYRVHASIAP